MNIFVECIGKASEINVRILKISSRDFERDVSKYIKRFR